MFSPLASGFLSGRYTAGQEYKGDDVRRVITRFEEQNVVANQPLLDLLNSFARKAGNSCPASFGMDATESGSDTRLAAR